MGADSDIDVYYVMGAGLVTDARLGCRAQLSFFLNQTIRVD